jgi:hypothetical protein
LYIYETTNNGPSASSFPISVNTVALAPPTVLSFGTFTGVAFTTPVMGAPAGFTDPSPASTGASSPTITTASGLSTPIVTLGATSLKAFFSPELTAGKSSVLWGVTSNFAPTFLPTGLIDGGTTADGTAAAPSVPEPSVIALSLVGLPFAAWILRRKPSR